MTPEERNNEIDRKYNTWVKSFSCEGSRGRNALDALETIKAPRSKDELRQLTDQAKRLCFEAVHYETSSFKDSGKMAREEVEAVLKAIPNQTAALKTLRQFIHEYPFHSSKGFEAAFLKTVDKNPLKQALDGWKGEITTEDFLDNIFSLYQKGLTYLEQGLSDAKKESYLALRVSGTLIYPDSLNKREKGANAAENDLLFNLAYLFRDFTNPSVKPFGLSKISGPLPDHGNPCYPHIAYLANAVFYESGDTYQEKNEFTDTKVADKIRKLKAKGVQIAPYSPPPNDVDY